MQIMKLNQRHKKDLTEIQVSKIFKLLLIFIFITNCSFHKNSKFWNKENIEEEKNEKKTEIFKKEEKLNFEFNPNLKIELDSRAVSNSFLKDFNNNSGRINYDSKLESISKYKFKKIKNFINTNQKSYLIKIILFFLITKVLF